MKTRFMLDLSKNVDYKVVSTGSKVVSVNNMIAPTIYNKKEAKKSTVFISNTSNILISDISDGSVVYYYKIRKRSSESISKVIRYEDGKNIEFYSDQDYIYLNESLPVEIYCETTTITETPMEVYVPSYLYFDCDEFIDGKVKRISSHYGKRIRLEVQAVNVNFKLGDDIVGARVVDGKIILSCFSINGNLMIDEVPSFTPDGFGIPFTNEDKINKISSKCIIDIPERHRFLAIDKDINIYFGYTLFDVDSSMPAILNILPPEIVVKYSNSEEVKKETLLIDDTGEFGSGRFDSEIVIYSSIVNGIRIANLSFTPIDQSPEFKDIKNNTVNAVVVDDSIYLPSMSIIYTVIDGSKYVIL